VGGSETINAVEAIAADEQRIGLELVDTVIRDLFDVGLTLQSALPHVSGVGEQRLAVAIDGIDRVILTIRAVVLDLAAVDGDRSG
jgi:signal transduction histidine kinase